eukprot:Colp12_sorted_trinity150504_noHs@4749
MLSRSSKKMRRSMHIYDAASVGDVERVVELIKRGELIDKANAYGHTALINASFNGHLACVEVLLKAGANIEAEDIHNETALMGASINGHGEIVKRLLGMGANRGKQNMFGFTAKQLALKRGHDEVAALLDEFRPIATEPRMGSAKKASPGPIGAARKKTASSGNIATEDEKRVASAGKPLPAISAAEAEQVQLRKLQPLPPIAAPNEKGTGAAAPAASPVAQTVSLDEGEISGKNDSFRKQIKMKKSLGQFAAISDTNLHITKETTNTKLVKAMETANAPAAPSPAPPANATVPASGPPQSAKSSAAPPTSDPQAGGVGSPKVPVPPSVPKTTATRRPTVRAEQTAEELLSQKLMKRPTKEEMVNKGILKNTSMSPVLQARQEELHKAQTVDALSAKLAARPDVAELVSKGIMKDTSAQDQDEHRIAKFNLVRFLEKKLHMGDEEEKKEHRARVTFNEGVLVIGTWGPQDYCRQGDVTWALSKKEKKEIAIELNNFKQCEMEVHPESKHFTHFIKL